MSNSTSSVSAYWSTSRWLSGGDNSPSPSRFTTSFDGLDETGDHQPRIVRAYPHARARTATQQTHN